jgi:hypothetical protein
MNAVTANVLIWHYYVSSEPYYKDTPHGNSQAVKEAYELLRRKGLIETDSTGPHLTGARTTDKGRKIVDTILAAMSLDGPPQAGADALAPIKEYGRKIEQLGKVLQNSNTSIDELVTLADALGLEVSLSITPKE